MSQQQGGATAVAARGPSLVNRAKAGDAVALATMFSQFLPRGEQIIQGYSFGVLGLWGIGTHSFAAVTHDASRRFASRCSAASRTRKARSSTSTAPRSSSRRR